MSNDCAIKVENLHKEFVMQRAKSNSLKQAFISRVKREGGTDILHALKGVSFEVKPGEFFGITGRNGSGKSTLLRILAGVYRPSSGGVHINGKLIPFIELGVGFNPDLSGRDNVFLNGSLLGFSRKQMAAMYKDIVEFAELERFMDQKLKNYSSGMQVRLAFSIAIRAKGDILVLDEVLAVGDAAFQKKCYEYFDKAKEDPNQTIIFVTHSMDKIEKYCDRAIMLKDGEIIEEGEPGRVAAAYNLENTPKLKVSTDKEDASLHLKSVRINNKKDPIVDIGKDIIIKLKLLSRENKQVHARLTIKKSDETPVIETNTEEDGGQSIDLEADGAKSFSYTIDSEHLKSGTYIMDVVILGEERNTLVSKSNVAKFAIQNKNKAISDTAELIGKWKL